MDAPLDFRLDRNRILSSGLSSGSFGNYDAAFAESNRVSALNRSASGSIPDLARIGTPASFPSRYFHHSVSSQGSSYPLLGSYLPGTVPSSEHLKSLLPEEYWASHVDGPRYVLNNNLYSPYFPYLPATESLSLFAHNLSSGGADQSGYHRIYDLRKDAALYSGLQMGHTPPVGPQSATAESSVKKDAVRTDSKRSETGKSTSKSQDSTTKLQSSQKTSYDKRSEVKRIEKSQTSKTSSSTSSKLSNVKKDKSRTDDKLANKQDDKTKSAKKDEKIAKICSNTEYKTTKCDVQMTDSKTNTDKTVESKISEDDDEKEEREEISDQLKDTKLSKTKESHGIDKDDVTMATVISSSSVVPAPSQLKPVATTDPFKSSTATTFSLPYYHSLFSTTPPILPSSLSGSNVTTVPLCTEPVQTVPCDMRIKKEPAVYASSKTIETKTTQSIKNQRIDSKIGQVFETSVDKRSEKSSEKSTYKPKLSSSVSTASSNVMPLCLKKHILEKSKELTTTDNSANQESNCEVTNVTKTSIKPVDNCSLDTKSNETSKPNGCEEDKTLADLKPKHSKEIQNLTTTSKDTVKAISKVLSKRQESTESLKSNTDNTRMLSSPRKQEQKIPTKRVLIKPKCDDKKTTGVSNIPIGIAVARKREDLKKDDCEENTTDSRESGESTNGSSQSNSSQDRPMEQSSSATKSIPNINVMDIRSQLPANLIVTGSASGTGIAWSDDPSTRHFPTQWLQTAPQLNQSWIGQLPFQIPPSIPTSGTTDQTLPITIPPGYKIAQDSVTGQLVMIPSNDIEIYDPSRIWSSFAAQPQTIVPSHQLPQLLPHNQDRAMSFVLPQYQHLLQNRQDNIVPSDNTQAQNIQTATTGSVKSKVTKDSVQNKPEKTTEKKTKSVGMVTPHVTTTGVGSSVQTLPYSYSGPVPLIVNSSNVSASAETTTNKPETSMVQSRGTSPMVPASEIEDAAQEMIDNSPAVQDKTDNYVHPVKKDIVTDDDESSFSSTDSFINARTNISDSKDDTHSLIVVTDKDNVSLSNCNNTLKCETSTINKVASWDQTGIKDTIDEEIDKKKELLPGSEGSILDSKNQSEVCQTDSDSCTEKIHSESKSEQIKNEKSEDYNPFLDPQILQAVDGLELLSALAEKRSKSLDTSKEPLQEHAEEEDVKSENEKEEEKKPTEPTTKAAKRTKAKRTLSRTRSIPPIKEQETPSYYTSTGLRIPQGEEEINAIELDMRIRLAELQRQYKEKQKLLSKLQPKKETPQKENKEKEFKELGDSKRGPGRPKKKILSSPGSDTSEKKMSPKSKEVSVKKKKPAEELVDRVFRKTGGGFGMPLSKKLKANAMAALFKTQSGFTVRRKGGSTSLMSAGKSFTSSEKSLARTKKHKTSSENKSFNSKSKISDSGSNSSPKSKKLKEETKEDSLKKWKKDNTLKEKVSEKKTDDSLKSGLGLLAKYATNALKEHISSKKIKRKRHEGSSEQENENISKTDDSIVTDTNQNNEACSIVSSPNVEDSDRKSEAESPIIKKRKPGRPRKGTPTRTTGVTETLVAKPSKNFQMFQYQSFQDLAKRNHDDIPCTPTEETESTMKPLFLDEEWLLRRSERIFLSDPSPQPSPNYSQPKPSPTKTVYKSEPKSKSDQAKLQKAKNMKEITQKVKKKYKKSMEKRTNQRAKEKKEYERKQSELKKIISKSVETRPPVEIYDDDSSESEGDNIPLSRLIDRPSTPAPRTCVLSEEDLVDGLNVLVFKDSLFYEGTVQPIHPPDIYGVLIQNERGNRPHIYSREEILKEVVLDLKFDSIQILPEGTRVCAYWSQQFNCLYPGTVSKGTPNSSPDKDFINVEFDDGDSGRIPLDHIRQLPADFPLVSYDPNPLLLIGKRRRHTTSEIFETRKSESYHTPDSQPKVKRGPGRPPKIKQENFSEDEQDIDVCGFDESDSDNDDTDNVFSSSQKHNKHHSAKRKHKSDNDKDEKVKKKKHDDKKKDRNVFEDQVIIPARHRWCWHGKSTKRPGMKGKARKEYYKEIVRGREEIKVGDCAVFVSTGRPHLPYIGRIDSMWESWGGQMTVKVKWFYHPEETRGGKKLQDMKRALFQSPHFDENDVQTISHKCEVISYTDYRRGKFDKLESSDVYYLAGTYEPTIGLLKFEQDVM